MSERSYACHVCGWQGSLVPSEPGDGALCDSCGVLLYPRTWRDTWGTSLLWIGIAIAAVIVVVYLR